jgi:hypothetical protein
MIFLARYRLLAARSCKHVFATLKNSRHCKKEEGGAPTGAYPTVRIKRMRMRADRSALTSRRSAAALV